MYTVTNDHFLISYFVLWKCINVILFGINLFRISSSAMYKNIFTEQFFPDYYNAVYTETLDQIYNVDIDLHCHQNVNKYGKMESDLDSDHVQNDLVPNICEDENGTTISSNSKKLGLKGNNPGIVNFVVELLHNPDTNPSIIKWEDYENGKFRFTNPEKVSKLWGRRNSRSKEKEMDFGKFSRAIRYHYGQGNFTAVPEQKLVYKFGPNAKGWRTED
ncbi:hypothetical protein AMK59_5199 [Oryctes borbonicus]|uniref:ETS domain-containing protein n=1 Tax=Oryctes borbonicus TaxID=1629725 RepID=A0A0T6B0A1_9SCAR|nr:hypothetical protein AMK59_5199 [Oryctes borbonicus]